MGVTISSRLPLGLYVRAVEPGSEAALAGVKEESALLSVNNMVSLAEPSIQTFERVWKYAGHLVEKYPTVETPMNSVADIMEQQLGRQRSQENVACSLIANTGASLPVQFMLRLKSHQTKPNKKVRPSI